MAGELTTLRAAVSSVAELVLGNSPSKTIMVEVTLEQVARFQQQEELCSWVEGPSARTCDLLLGLPPSQAQWANRLAEAVGQLEVELAARWQVDAELEAL
jgi:hypothetical protein